MNRIIDAKGKNCPIPVVMAKKEIDGGLTAFTIEVDNATAVENLQRLADSQGFRTTVQSGGGVFSIDFTKAPCEPCAAADAVISQGPSSGKWSVFVGREIIGDGDPELGASLMKMFFYTLTQSADLPASILFMNGGVKLPVHNEQIVEHLRELLTKGVEILVCGTCLNFYHLAEQLQVGTVSNMYEIVERMKQAGKVISL
ncbi:sulfurtransferase-like selenium metabolism protein YedF [Anaerotruncus colihominis]|uniref:Sulfurtransferase-like selenium metabolism protein YedF n=1 Tax=Anaerotruncus colihominis TaxID=169435 RepID=A0A845RHU4_9FIRM|nr:sulfurtransferase-like selenium metabolism protein YedF [Anaerotruncus colihominis]NBI79139.1 sulfurtransferase-like selenium metabolism protein YedF [Anaerotruncus colihominis]